jgi:hypothetical protein
MSLTRLVQATVAYRYTDERTKKGIGESSADT